MSWREITTNYSLVPKVTSFEIIDDHVQYQIKFQVQPKEPLAKWTVHQRFKRFKELDQNLRKSPKYVNGMPKLPATKWFQSFNQEYLELKRQNLQHYLTLLCSSSHIVGSSTLQAFAGVDKNLLKELHQIVAQHASKDAITLKGGKNRIPLRRSTPPSIAATLSAASSSVHATPATTSATSATSATTATTTTPAKELDYSMKDIQKMTSNHVQLGSNLQTPSTTSSFTSLTSSATPSPRIGRNNTPSPAFDSSLKSNSTDPNPNPTSDPTSTGYYAPLHVWKHGHPEEDAFVVMLMTRRTKHIVSCNELYDDAEDIRDSMEKDMFIVLTLTEMKGSPCINVAIEECNCDNESKKAGDVGSINDAADASHVGETKNSQVNSTISFVGTFGVNGHILGVVGEMDTIRGSGSCVFNTTSNDFTDNSNSFSNAMTNESPFDTLQRSTSVNDANAGNDGNNGKTETKQYLIPIQSKRTRSDTCLASNQLIIGEGTPPSTPKLNGIRQKKQEIITNDTSVFSPASRRRRKDEMEDLF